MNDIDLDIILAIADNRLTGQAKQDALERITADPELGEELAAQVAAMHELTSLDPAVMTPAERSALRTNLIAQLHLSPAARKVAVRTQRRRWWQPALAFASAAALLIAIVVVPSMFSSSDDSSADVVAIAPATVNTVATAPTVELESSAGSDSSTAGDTSPPATVLFPVIAVEEVEQSFNGGPLSGEVPQTLGDDDAEAAGSTDSASVDPLATLETVPVDEASLMACLESLSDDISGDQYVPWVATLASGSTVIHLGVDTGNGLVYSVSIDPETCSIVPLSP
jgi:hypothetical protein